MGHVSDDWYSTPRPGKRSVARLDTEAIACCIVGVDSRQYGRSRFRFRGSKEFGDRLSEGNLQWAKRFSDQVRPIFRKAGIPQCNCAVQDE